MNDVRLIDANALVEDINKAWLTGQSKVQFIKMVDNAPTVEPDKPIFSEIWVQERPKGKWIEFKYGFYYCSNCFDNVDKDIDRIEHFVTKRDLSSFCPCCGSLMKGKGKDND